MKQCIDKSAVVAEIKRIEHETNYEAFTDEVLGKRHVCKGLLSFLDTLEVKEADLEKEIELVKGDYEQVDVAWNNDFDFIAKHFFELGLKSQKGE